MSIIRITTLTMLFILLAALPSQPTSATVPTAPEQFSCANVTEIPQIECEALVALYNGMNGPNWRDTTGWLVTNTPCSWHWITCDGSHITELRLYGSTLDFRFGLEGKLPSEIGDLTSLTILNLSYNKISSLPDEIGNLNNLTGLYLSGNHLSSIPTQISNLSNLTWLYLDSNLLSSLPAEIDDLTSLTVLSLSNNHLSSLPAQISNLNNLTELDLCHNQLSSLPNGISNFTNLTMLDLSSNQWSGLPDEIWTLTNLNRLFLSDNQLSSLPDEIGNLTNLTALYLSHNQLSSLPAEIGNLTNLTLLYLDGRQLNSLPAEIGNLTNLTTLNLQSTQLNSLPVEIGNLTNLTQLYLGGSQLSSLPTEIGNLTNLTQLYLGGNQLSSLPTEIGNLTNLTELDLQDNQLTNLPAEIGNLTNLWNLRLDHNQLTNLPAEIGNLTNLWQLPLNTNQLNYLPAEIGNLTNLRELQLNTNQLNSLPVEVGNLTSLTDLSLGRNQLSSLPAEIGNLTNLTLLSLYSNQLNSLPAEIGNLIGLNHLSLAYNRLEIPDSELLSFVIERDSDWADTQTIAPSEVKAIVLGENSIELTWTPITFQDKGGYYEISVAGSDSFMVHGTTVNKSTDRYTIDALTSGTIYEIRMRTYTPDHYGSIRYLWDDQPNELWSDYSELVSATTLDPTPTPTIISMSTRPSTHTPTPTNTPPSTSQADAYESNNSCNFSRPLTLNEPPQSHNFHTTADTDWTLFTAPTPGTYRIEVIIPDDSHADVDLYYYTECDSLAEDRYTETFAPGARLDMVAERAGQQFYIQVKNFDAGVFGPDVSYNLSARQMSSQQDGPSNGLASGPAIVVAGRYRVGDSVQENIDQIALDAYRLFEGKGRNDSEIFFLATDSSLPGYDYAATERNLELVITQEAKERLLDDNVSKVLTLYLVDHGDKDKLYLDRLEEEILTPEDLDQWLSTLEAAIPGLKVNVFIEACHAGSFITRPGGTISKEGRVIITSSDEDYDAFVSRHGAAFSDDFITFLHQEYNLGYSYQQSVNRLQDIHGNQEPWIDADGNSIPNEPNDISIASLRSFAEPGSLGDDWPPYIAATSQTGGLSGIQAEVRHQGGNSDIEEVWAVVYPPDYVAPTGRATDADDGVLNEELLDVIEFEADGEANYVETEAYPGFTQPGVYRVVIQARDVNGLVARPVTVEVDTRHWMYLPVIQR